MPLAHSGLGGIAVDDGRVIFGDRDVDDFHDVWRCLDAATGETLWEVERLSIGALDYGNSPRATPTINGRFAYLQGALGVFLCVDVRSGEVVWEIDFTTEHALSGELPWGYCGSPLLVDEKVIVAPGSADASLMALNAKTGARIWATEGALPSYGSLIVCQVNGLKQIVGHDGNSLGGWSVQNGQRLWKVVPDLTGDFNVPTPLMFGSQLLVTTENNGTRLFDFDTNGAAVSAPVAMNRNLRPDMSTPVLVGNRLYCVNKFLYCLDVANGLQELWRMRDKALSDYGAIIASEQHVLVIGDGELLLLKADGSKQIVSRQKIFNDELPIYSHPAICDGQLFIRGENSIVCLKLSKD